MPQHDAPLPGRPSPPIRPAQVHQGVFGTIVGWVAARPEKVSRSRSESSLPVEGHPGRSAPTLRCIHMGPFRWLAEASHWGLQGLPLHTRRREPCGTSSTSSTSSVRAPSGASGAMRAPRGSLGPAALADRETLQPAPSAESRPAQPSEPGNCGLGRGDASRAKILPRGKGTGRFRFPSLLPQREPRGEGIFEVAGWRKPAHLQQTGLLEGYAEPRRGDLGASPGCRLTVSRQHPDG